MTAMAPRKTKIVCTLGPAVDNEEMIEKLIHAGMDGARFNFSHGTHVTHLEMLQKLKTVRERLGVPVATMLDTKGPEIRIRTFVDGSVSLTTGESFTLTTREVPGTKDMVSVTYDNLHSELSVGNLVLIDDGLIELVVKEIRCQDIICTVKTGGGLSNNKSINIPDVNILLPSLTEKDRQDLRFAVEQDFDYVAASFIRKAQDVEDMRVALKEYGGEKIRIIAKIENREGVTNLEEIIAASDGVMVARGDLGVEIPASEVPVVQKRMINMTIAQGKIVITATQMLDSMIRNPRPTRAEISDVANAVFDGTSCVMLSGETASGKYPIEALSIMAETCEQAESSIHYWKRFSLRNQIDVGNLSTNDAISYSCCYTAMMLNASCIVSATSSGKTARLVSRYRPACPVVAAVSDEKAWRQLALNWAVVPMRISPVDTTDEMFALCTETAKKAGVAKLQDRIVITAGIPLNKTGSTNLIKAQRIRD